MERNKVEEAVRELRNLDISDGDAHQKAKQLFLSVGQLHVAIGTLEANNSLCRTRTHFDNVLYTDVSEISTPESRYVTKYGRCNKPHCPIFYCSDELQTSYSELAHDWLRDCPDGSILYATVSTWNTKQDTNVVIVASPDIEKRITQFDKHFGRRLDEVNANLDANEREGAIAYQRFLHETFSKPSKENVLTYIITSAYSELALQAAEKRADGIVYPSVPRQGVGLNYALRPEYIKSGNLELQGVSRRIIKRRDIPDDLPELKEIETLEALRDYNNGEIRWCSNAAPKSEK